MHVIAIMHIIACSSVKYGWNLLALGWFMRLTTRILYVIPIQSILGKLPVVPVGDTGTIPFRLRNTFSGAPVDRRQGVGDGCKMWFVNSWALGWSRDM
jgi:hypothetical protein